MPIWTLIKCSTDKFESFPKNNFRINISFNLWLELSKGSTFLLWLPFPIISRKYKDEYDKQYPETSYRVSNQKTKERTRKRDGVIKIWSRKERWGNTEKELHVNSFRKLRILSSSFLFSSLPKNNFKLWKSD